MTEFNARTAVVAQLKPALPETWKWVPNPRNVDVLEGPTVALSQSGFTPLPASPRGAYLADLVVTIAVPNRDPITAEDVLDDAAAHLASALDLSPFIWSGAQRVTFGLDSPAYDFQVQVVLQTATEETEIEEVPAPAETEDNDDSTEGSPEPTEV